MNRFRIFFFSVLIPLITVTIAAASDTPPLTRSNVRRVSISEGKKLPNASLLLDKPRTRRVAPEYGLTGSDYGGFTNAQPPVPQPDTPFFQQQESQPPPQDLYQPPGPHPQQQQQQFDQSSPPAQFNQPPQNFNNEPPQFINNQPPQQFNEFNNQPPQQFNNQPPPQFNNQPPQQFNSPPQFNNQPPPQFNNQPPQQFNSPPQFNNQLIQDFNQRQVFPGANQLDSDLQATNDNAQRVDYYSDDDYHGGEHYDTPHVVSHTVYSDRPKEDYIAQTIANIVWKVISSYVFVYIANFVVGLVSQYLGLSDSYLETKITLGKDGSHPFEHYKGKTGAEGVSPGGGIGYGGGGKGKGKKEYHLKYPIYHPASALYDQPAYQYIPGGTKYAMHGYDQYMAMKYAKKFSKKYAKKSGKYGLKPKPIAPYIPTYNYGGSHGWGRHSNSQISKRTSTEETSSGKDSDGDVTPRANKDNNSAEVDTSTDTTGTSNSSSETLSNSLSNNNDTEVSSSSTTETFGTSVISSTSTETSSVSNGTSTSTTSSSSGSSSTGTLETVTLTNTPSIVASSSTVSSSIDQAKKSETESNNENKT